MAKNSFEPSWPVPPSLEGMDRRARRTRMALAEALIGLLAEKPLEAITIRELTEAADVNRSTFYVHFQDIYDMVRQMKWEMYERCRELIRAHGVEIERYDLRNLMRDLLEYLEDNEAVFSVLVEDGAGMFGAEFTECMRDTFMDIIRPLEHLDARTRARAEAAGIDLLQLCGYHFDCVFNGMLGFVNRWIASGRRESVELLVALAGAYSDALDFNDVTRRLLAEL